MQFACLVHFDFIKYSTAHFVVVDIFELWSVACTKWIIFLQQKSTNHIPHIVFLYLFNMFLSSRVLCSSARLTRQCEENPFWIHNIYFFLRHKKRKHAAATPSNKTNRIILIVENHHWLNRTLVRVCFKFIRRAARNCLFCNSTWKENRIKANRRSGLTFGTTRWNIRVQKNIECESSASISVQQQFRGKITIFTLYWAAIVWRGRSTILLYVPLLFFVCGQLENALGNFSLLSNNSLLTRFSQRIKCCH